MACAAGSYKVPNGSSPCVACLPGKYSTALAAMHASTCVNCPQHTSSVERNNNLTHCVCIKGFTGPNGKACVACPAGTYKFPNGSTPCVACAIVKYNDAISQISESACSICPNHTSSSAGSPSISNCKCNVGYTGADGHACTACVGGWKNVTGSSACIPCSQGKYPRSYLGCETAYIQAI